MELTVGTVYEGKVTGITKFGAFVALPEGKSGMVHISEVASAYVEDIRQYLTEGQEVKVKLISIDDAGRINLSIKKAAPERPRSVTPAPAPMPSRSTLQKSADLSFEDKLKQFMQASESKISDMKLNNDRRNSKKRSR
ncbi:S1 RNA-binding domain-containing protein [Acidaminobacterium chupaoyuni]